MTPDIMDRFLAPPKSTGRARRVWSKLIEPSAAVEEDDARRRARLTAALLLVLMPIGLAGTLLGAFVLEPMATTPQLTGLGLAAAGLLLVSYALSRSRKPASGAALFVSTTFVFSILAAWVQISATGDDQSLAFLVNPILLTALLLGVVPTIAISLLALGSVFALPMVHPGLAVSGVVEAGLFLAGVAGLLVVFAYLRDKNLERMAKQANDLQEAQHLARVGSWSWSASTGLVHGSKQLSRITGDHQATAGIQLAQALGLVHPGDMELLQRSLDEALGTDGSMALEHRILRPDGEVRFVQTRAQIDLDAEGEPVAAFGTVQDVTERMLAQQALEDHMRQLERSNQELERFAYISSHDLKEPLRMVSSYVQLLARRYEGQLDEDADTYIGYAVQGTRRMNELIDDLLAYARLRRAQPIREPVSIAEVLGEIMHDLAATIEETHATVTWDPMPTVPVHPTQIRQVLSNLVSNAIKFRGDDPPEIHVGVQEHRDRWTLSVRDNGIGIEPAYQEKIFELFQRLHHHETVPGTGIGLAVCQRIVEAHGGRIWVESRPGQGSVFRFTIPKVPVVEPSDPRIDVASSTLV